MAAHDDKTEEATEKKLRDAIEKGNIPVSREATTFASIIGILIVMAFLVKEGAMQLSVALQRLMDDPGGWSLQNSADAGALFGTIAAEAFKFLVPIFATLCLFGLIASFSQNVPNFAFDRIQPDASRLSPAQGWSRIFGQQGQIEFLKSALKFGGISAVIFVLLNSEQSSFMNAMFTQPNALPDVILSMTTRLLAAIAIATVLLVTADMLWARIKWRRDLRMTRQELKDEFKQSEGDPLMRSKLRSLALDRSRKRMIGAVPRATLVIANPTHYAIALRYVREEGGAPLVVAKGKDLIALKIREIAEQHQIPVVEDKALARSMYDSVEVDRMIPPELYRAVAEVVHFLYAKKTGGTTAGWKPSNHVDQAARRPSPGA
ncbi:flagellar biosynthetic protein FlhB [Rhizobiales bacterium GAS191]|jgi:flagellar biosynthetic protein FlhB|nr:flagellar biosynthetic protein FlhB [Rhizobiales bacterium GAS113]SEC17412.1 flagellar biosynthetic protein FlhB [Rhizobiales bacterium GAS191]SED04129.1 flagellar biosynthetic protein FlhB [Rhizobiales bacterium GAS188]